MLVITRNRGESLTIEPSPDLNPNMTVGELFAKGPINVVVLGVHGRGLGSVKLGIEADSRLLILRGELRKPP